MKVTMLLCDHAQIADHKLFINGAGWNMCGTPTPPHAIAVLVSVPWDQTNVRFDYQLQLVHEDGRDVTQQGPAGPVPVGASGTFEVGRPSGVRPGTAIAVPLVINVAPLPLDPDTGFEWRLLIAGITQEGWSLPFRTLR